MEEEERKILGRHIIWRDLLEKGKTEGYTGSSCWKCSGCSSCGKGCGACGSPW